jgi:hypothetical protein
MPNHASVLVLRSALTPMLRSAPLLSWFLAVLVAAITRLIGSGDGRSL